MEKGCQGGSYCCFGMSQCGQVARPKSIGDEI